MPRTFFLDQHGCAKNQVDGELIISRLKAKGFVLTQEANKADLIIVNSCGFIEKAKTESLDALMSYRAAFPKAKIMLAGCLAERYADVFKEELSEADAILGNGDISLVDKTTDLLFKGERPIIKAEQKGVCCGPRDTLLSFKGSTYVKITEGCNNRCTFCAIPLIRGTLRSRAIPDIVREVEALISSGIKEINLIGQDLAAYGSGKSDVLQENNQDESSSALSRLLKALSQIQGHFWLRLLYIHPDHFPKDILPLLKADSRILPYFDIPFQSGSTRIISAMNRRGTKEEYIALVKTIRNALPTAAIRTTFLTGFPGETEADANDTKDFLCAIQSDWSGCFTYSREEDTPAAKMKMQVPHKIALERERALEQEQEKITQSRLSARCGKIYEVLVEEIVQNPDSVGDEGLAIGRAWFQAPEVDGSIVIRYDLSDTAAVSLVQPGSFVRVYCDSCSGVDLEGELLV